MKKFLLITAFMLFLPGCSNNSPTPPPPPPPPPPSPSISIPPGAQWVITQGSAPRSLTNGVFDFQSCASASICWDSYVETPINANISQTAAITFSYTITGIDPVFVNDTPGNTCSPPNPALSLYLRWSGDPGFTNPLSRWFSIARAPLALGPSTFTVGLHDASIWTPVYGGTGTSIAFSQTLASIGSLGFVMGGGCFAGHGVAVSSGRATLTIDSYEIK